jgi:predicted dehydrogenase
MSTPSLALIGCGAVADVFHLPALRRRPDLLPSLILVDPNIEQARRVREAVGGADAVANHREVLSRVQGAIIATPHHLHYPITLDCIGAGVHVLCEKPLASSRSEVDDIVAAAERSKVRVAVDHTRRFFSSFREVQRLAASGELGEIREIDYELGEPFGWPAATESYFGIKGGGRGVLFDTGAHVVDLVCWWMGGEPDSIDYRDDARGGTEAVCKIVMQRGPTTARVHLSWLTKLRNTYRVVGTRGSVEGGVYEWSSLSRFDASGKKRRVATDRPRQLADFFDMLLANFVDVVSKGAAPTVSAADARAVISVIDRCYADRHTLPEPWHDACRELAHV